MGPFSNLASIVTSTFSSTPQATDAFKGDDKATRQIALTDFALLNDRALLRHLREEERGQRGKSSDIDQLLRRIDKQESQSNSLLSTRSSGHLGEIAKNGVCAFAWGAAAATGIYFSFSAAFAALPDSTIGILSKAGSWGLVLGLSFVAAWQGLSRGGDMTAHIICGISDIWNGGRQDDSDALMSAGKARNDAHKGEKGSKSKGKKSGKKKHGGSDE